MDLKDAKTQKIVIAVLACFIVGYFWYNRLYSVNHSKIVHKSQEFEHRATPPGLNTGRVPTALERTGDRLRIDVPKLVGSCNEYVLKDYAKAQRGSSQRAGTGLPRLPIAGDHRLRTLTNESIGH